MREHARHPRLEQEGPLQQAGPTATGQVLEQAISLAAAPMVWRRIELRLDTPLETGERVLRLWSNLPAEVSAQKIAELYRRRWHIEGMFQRLESVLHSEIRSLGHPRAALLGFAVAVLAYNVLSVLKRSVEQAHRETVPQLEVSTYYLAQDIRTGYEGMLIALPPPFWRVWFTAQPEAVAQRLLQLARHVAPKRIATHKRGPKSDKPKEYIDGVTARAHFSTSRVLKQARAKRP